MDTLSMLLYSPGAAQGHLDENFGNNDGGRYYGSDGEATNVNHAQFQEGADCGRASGSYIPVDNLRGRRIASN